MPVFAFGIPWDQEYYIGQLEVLTKQRIDKLDKEYKRLKYYTKNQQADIAQLRKKYKITVRDLQLFIDFGLALDVRNEAEYLVSLAGFYAMPIYREIARRLYISTTQLRKLVQDEIVKALAGEVIVQNILNKRGKIFGWGANPKMDKKIDFSDQESEKLLSYLNKKAVSIQGHDESQGKCASLGKVIGRVKIVNSPQENDKVKKGDILVCHVTTVDYLPAMKIAAGFVTEIGSLTCHAAVVAREFGVPCVVSLKNATKNFKDNDKVELDADKGTLRKVK